MLLQLSRFLTSVLILATTGSFFYTVFQSELFTDDLNAANTTTAQIFNYAEAIPYGPAKLDIEIDGVGFDIFTYKPKNYKGGPLLVVFHGMLRDADDYRDHAIELAERNGVMIAAPQFDDDRFPSLQYQQGGLIDNDKNVVPKEQWTLAFVPKIIDRIRSLAGSPDMPYYMIGHSAGGQFLVRYSGFMETDAKRIVAANPGSQLFPNIDQAYPYGFGMLPEELANNETIRRYLAQPLTIYLGTADVISELLDMSEEAMIQGETRYERGKKAFELAQEVAQKNGWKFNWRLVEAEGIKHDGKAMLCNPACEKALFGDKKLLP